MYSCIIFVTSWVIFSTFLYRCACKIWWLITISKLLCFCIFLNLSLLLINLRVRNMLQQISLHHNKLGHHHPNNFHFKVHIICDRLFTYAVSTLIEYKKKVTATTKNRETQPISDLKQDTSINRELKDHIFVVHLKIQSETPLKWIYMQIGFMNTSFVDRIIRYKADLLAVFVLLAVGIQYILKIIMVWVKLTGFMGKMLFYYQNLIEFFIFLLCGLIWYGTLYWEIYYQKIVFPLRSIRTAFSWVAKY